jgi:hypothetical protein
MRFNEMKQRLDPKCWTGKKIGNPKTKVKGGVRVNNCVPKEGMAEGSMYGDEEVSWEKGGRRAPTGAFRNPAAEKIDQANKILDNPNSSPDMKKAAASILGQEQMLLRQYYRRLVFEISNLYRVHLSMR